MTRPLTPHEVKQKQIQKTPSFVIEAVNTLLVAYGYHPLIILKQSAVIAAILGHAPPDTQRADIFANGWLDFIPAFREYGWHVVYDKPGYNESYEPSYEFRPREEAYEQKSKQ